jgi:hypothetical protein
MLHGERYVPIVTLSVSGLTISDLYRTLGCRYDFGYYRGLGPL